MQDERTCLYRHFNSNGELLYVGISLDFVRRLQQHMIGSCWSEDIFLVTVTWFSTLAEAIEAEKAAIVEERPKWNKRYNERLIQSSEKNKERVVNKTSYDGLLRDAGYPVSDSNSRRLFANAQRFHNLVTFHEQHVREEINSILGPFPPATLLRKLFRLQADRRGRDLLSRCGLYDGLEVEAPLADESVNDVDFEVLRGAA